MMLIALDGVADLELHHRRAGQLDGEAGPSSSLSTRRLMPPMIALGALLLHPLRSSEMTTRASVPSSDRNCP